MPEINHYHPATGRHLTSVEARLDPIDENPMVPRFATLKAPPLAGKNEAAVFNEQTDSWSLVPDYEGTAYWLPDGSRGQITAPGIEPPADALFEAPARPLDDIKASRIEDLAAACEQSIISNFSSAALGTPHQYKSDRDDQLNLIGVAQAAADSELRCFDGTDWQYRPHTALQISQVFADGVDRKMSLLQQLDTKRAEVNNAADAAAVDAVSDLFV